MKTVTDISAPRALIDIPDGFVPIPAGMAEGATALLRWQTIDTRPVIVNSRVRRAVAGARGCMADFDTPGVMGGVCVWSAPSGVEALCEGGFVLSHRLADMLGPVMVLFRFLLARFGGAGRFDDTASTDIKSDLLALEDLVAQADILAQNSRYWQGAIMRLLFRAEAVRAEGKDFHVPEWFIWLGRYGTTIAPGRLRAIMATNSLRGRAVVLGLLGTHMSESKLSSASTRSSAPYLTPQSAHYDVSEHSLNLGLWYAQMPPD